MRLWRHPNKRWYVCYGARSAERISTGTEDRDTAEIFFARFKVEHHVGPVDSDISVRDILESYASEYGPKVRSPDAIRFAVAGLIPHLGKLLPHHLTPTTIDAYAKKRGASDGTVLREIGVLRAALEWAAKHNRIPRDQLPKISNPVPTPQPRDRWMTREEYAKVKAECLTPHLRIFVVLGTMTVPRMGALLDAKLAQVDWERRIIDYGKGHGNKKRAVVPLNDDAMEALELAKQLSVSGYIVEYHGRKLDTVKKGFAAACKRAGIKGVTPHILRHTGATWMALAAVPMQQIANMLGDSLATTERVYAKYHPDYLRGAADALQGRKSKPVRRSQSGAKASRITARKSKSEAALQV